MARKKKPEPESNGSTALLDPPGSREATATERPDRFDPGIGDKVQRKDGGPVMTVVESDPSDAHDTARCQWKSHSAEPLHAVFEVKVLKPAEDEPAPASPTPETEKGSDLDDPIAWRDDVKKATSRVQELRSVYLGSKEQASADKKAWESASEELQRFILREPKPLPLFDRKPEANGKPKAEAAPAEPWREEFLASLVGLVDDGITPALADDLVDKGFKTIGHVADWTAKGSRLTDIPGVGPAKAEKIERSMEAFWAEQRADEIDAGREVIDSNCEGR